MASAPATPATMLKVQGPDPTDKREMFYWKLRRRGQRMLAVLRQPFVRSYDRLPPRCTQAVERWTRAAWLWVTANWHIRVPDPTDRWEILSWRLRRWVRSLPKTLRRKLASLLAFIPPRWAQTVETWACTMRRRIAKRWRPVAAAWNRMFPRTLFGQDRQSSAARRAGILLILGGITLMVVISATSGRGLRRFYKDWRSARLLREAVVLHGRDLRMEAVRRANAAYVMNPDNPDAIRQLAIYATELHRYEAKYLIGKLRALGVMTEGDSLLEIEALSNLSEDKEALERLQALLREGKSWPKIAELADRVLSRLGRKQQLVEMLKEHLRLRPGDTSLRLRLARRQLELGVKEHAQEAVASLWDLAEDPGPTGLEAVEILALLTLVGEEDQRRLVVRLQEHPLGTEHHRIAGLRRLASLEPERRAELMDEAIAVRRSAAPGTLVPLATWLTLDGAHEKVLTLLREDQVQRWPPLLNCYLEALVHLGRHEDMERLINDPATNLTTAERSLYRVECAFARNPAADTLHPLLVESLAALLAEFKPQLLLTFAILCEKRNHPRVAEHAYHAASRITTINRPATEGLMRTAYQNGNTETFLQACATAMDRWPDHRAYEEMSLYACLLTGLTLESSAARARELLTGAPADSQLRLLAALASCREGDSDAAARHLEAIDPNRLSPGQGAVLCGLLQLTGRTAQAGTLARQIPAGAGMLPEEASFLARSPSDRPIIPHGQAASEPPGAGSADLKP